MVSGERPVNALDRYFMKLHEYRERNAGDYPKVAAVIPEEYRDILAQLEVLGTRTNATEHVLFGVKLVVVPFTQDLLFKRLQVMARLVGAEIEYPMSEGEAQPKLAEFFKDGAGWRYYRYYNALVPISGPWPYIPTWEELQCSLHS